MLRNCKTNLRGNQKQKGEVNLRLREIRLEKKLTVPALSRLSGVPVRTIENIEKREECTVTNAKKLAAALKISTIKINQLPKSNQAKTSVFATFVITNKATVEEKFHIDTSFLIWYNISIPKKGEELSLSQAIT